MIDYLTIDPLTIDPLCVPPCVLSVRFNRIAHTRETMNKDGINSLTYKVVKMEKFDLYTKITVDVGKP